MCGWRVSFLRLANLKISLGLALYLIGSLHGQNSRLDIIFSQNVRTLFHCFLASTIAKKFDAIWISNLCMLYV